MIERNSERQKAFEALEEKIDEHFRIVEKVIPIFSKIKKNPSSIEDLKDILTKVSYLKNPRGTQKFDKSDLCIITGKLGNLRTALERIKNIRDNWNPHVTT